MAFRSGWVVASGIALLALFACYLPDPYYASFPPGAPKRMAEADVLEGASFLALPCWREQKSSRRRHGPPFLVDRATLEAIDGEVKDRRGVKWIDLFGHEGSKKPVACGLTVISDVGRIVRVELVVRRHAGRADSRSWEDVAVGSIGPRFEVALRTLFAGRQDPDASRQIFGRYGGELVGDSGALGRARAFLDAHLEPRGDDLWRSPEKPPAVPFEVFAGSTSVLVVPYWEVGDQPIHAIGSPRLMSSAELYRLEGAIDEGNGNRQITEVFRDMPYARPRLRGC